jgi:phage repressor protein C with HTH and peptisase S24 domain
METLGSTIKKARTDAKLTQQQLADQLQINRVNITQWEKDETRPAADRLPALAALLGVSREILEKFIDEDGPARRRARGTPAGASPIIPGAQLLGPGRMPVYAAAMGGDGHIIVTFEAIDHMKMPSELENVKGGYGLLISGESMIPAFWPGDTALVNPHLQPQKGRNVILYHTPPNGGEVEAIVKQLEGWSDREWLLKQYNPLLEFTEYRKEWPVCHRVVGKYDAR